MCSNMKVDQKLKRNSPDKYNELYEQSLEIIDQYFNIWFATVEDGLKVFILVYIKLQSQFELTGPGNIIKIN